ncbi:basic proline-rich protein-like [Felis catus]|uniref:basic proline-rich protein-like n=1 Tax=Felis catus TaxID=9685 RepID=UPI001D19A497|nr:basic proline-rich protein-like [Felis catus]XP_044893671.1 basic proline-rich protein-like [Felis catus]XP_044893672.1 basic proline-rich protein-like [Felis catus]XP_044893673.1 basic proline-rich protein-like [Felis catus]XP_044893674.1 basic proline-rich protein-like [Felis catus]XP_044893675.1 basic proline-rich protein-like [Felis catus]XP_044893676.1 basic proline-rich protein-like [Felis catus]XP_044893677.1 basic proline-rich protein-like [Felis catus]
MENALRMVRKTPGVASRWPPCARRAVTRAQTGARRRAVPSRRAAPRGHAGPGPPGPVPRRGLPGRAVPSPAARPPAPPPCARCPVPTLRRGRAAPARPGEGLPGGGARAAGPPPLTSSPSPRCTLSGEPLPSPGWNAAARPVPPQPAARLPPRPRLCPQRLARAPPLPPLRQWPRPPPPGRPGPQLTAWEGPPSHSREPLRTPEPGRPPGSAPAPTRPCPRHAGTCSPRPAALRRRVPPDRGRRRATCRRGWLRLCCLAAPGAAAPSPQSKPFRTRRGAHPGSRSSPHAGRAARLQLGTERIPG